MIPRIPQVRLYDPDADADYSQPVDKPIPEGHKVLEGHPAVDGNGDPLPVKVHADLATNVTDGKRKSTTTPETHVTGQENN